MKRLFLIYVFSMMSYLSFGQDTYKHLRQLKPGDTVKNNDSEYVIKNSKYQSIREFAKVGSNNGTLILYGGGKLSDVMLHIFEEEIGSKDSKIIAITTANCRDEVLDVGNYYLGHLKNYGFTNIEVLHTRDVNEANSQDFSDKLEGAKGIWIEGGGSECLVTPYLHTKFHDSLLKFLNKGGVIAGTSAGAVGLGSYFQSLHGQPDRIGKLEFEGFGFLKNVTIAAHIDTYNKEFKENIKDVIDHYYPGLLGIGIEENTAVIIEKDLLTVKGSGLAKIYDSKTIVSLKSNETYQLANREKID